MTLEEMMKQDLAQVKLPEPIDTDIPYNLPINEMNEANRLGLDFGDVFKSAMYKDSLVAMAVKDVPDFVKGEELYAIDSNFTNTEKEKVWKEYGLDNAIHPNLKKAVLSNARSKEHLDSTLDYYYNESAKYRALENESGLTQFGLGFVAELTNAPLYIGSAMLLPATSGVLASTATSRFLASGLAGVALEAGKDNIGEYDKTLLDYSLALIMDGTLGSVFGNPRNLKMKEIAEANIYKTFGVSKDTISNFANMSKSERIKALKDSYFKKNQQEPSDDILNAIDNNIKYSTSGFIEKGWRALRQDLEYKTKNSPSESMSMFGNSMFHDATLQNITPDMQDLATKRALIEETMRAKRQKVFRPLIKEYSLLVHNSGGLFGIIPTPQVQMELSQLLGNIQLMRDMQKINIDVAIEESIRKARLQKTDELVDLLKRASKGMEELSVKYYDLLANYGNKKFKSGEIPKNPTYMTYMYDKNTFATLRNNGVSEKELINFFRDAFRSSLSAKGIEPNEKLTKSVATLFYKSVTSSHVDNKNTFTSILDDLSFGKELDDEARTYIDSLKKEYDFTKPDEESGVFGRARSAIDYKFKKKIKTEDGKEIELSFDKFMNKDYFGVMDTYARKMSGTTALSEYKFTRKGRKVSSIEALEQVSKDKEIIDLKNKIKHIEDNSITQEEADALYTMITDLVGKIDKRKKYSKELIKAIDNRDFKAIYDVLEKYGSEIYTKMNADSRMISSITNIVNKINRIDSSNYDELKQLLEKNQIKKMKDYMDLKSKDTEVYLETPKDIAELESIINKELKDKVISGEITKNEANKELVRFKTIIKDMLGIPTAKDPLSNLNRLYRISHAHTIGSLLGQTLFSMPSEMMNVAWDSGMRNMLDSMKELKSLLGTYKSGKITNRKIEEINDFLGIYDEFMSSSRLFEFEHDYSSLTRGATRGKNNIVDKTESFLENFAEFTLMVGGIKPLTAWFQTAHISGVFNKMRAVANGATKDSNYIKMINELGLSKESEELIYKQILKHSDNEIMNFKNWDNDIRTLFTLGVKRRTDTLVQVQRLGDKPAWVSEADYMFKDTIAGKFVLELKSFVLTSYVKQLGRAITRSDMYIAGLMASQMLALSLSYITKQYYNFAGNEDKLKERLQPEEVVKGTIGMMPQGSILPMLVNMGVNLTTDYDLLGSNRNNGFATSTLSALPIVDKANKLAQILGTPKDLYSEDYVKAIKPIAGLTGISNNILTRPLYEGIIAP